MWIVFAAVTAAVLVLMLFPLLRRGKAPLPDRVDFDLSVYRDQLSEIDRDVERALIDSAEAQAARTEIKRRLLADVDDRSSSRPPARPGRRSAALAGFLAVAVAAGAFGAYAVLGTPEAPDQPLSARRTAPAIAGQMAGGEPTAAPSLEEAVRRLQQRLAEAPDDLKGWILLGRSFLTLDRYEDAASAFRHAVDLSDGRPDIAAGYGEALVAAANGRLTPEAREAFQRAFDHDPLNAKARYYLALGKAQQGDVRGALQDWVDLIALASADAPWLGVVRRQIGRAAGELGIDPAALKPSVEAAALAEKARRSGPMPDDEAAAAQMSDADQEAMIRSMVARLAARLEEEPDDLRGWQMLARAYDVLGEPEKAKRARARADALKKP